MTTAFASLPSLDLQGAPCDLRVVDVQKHYDGFRLGPVSLDIPRDSVVGLIGQNGAGKTTLMKGILGTIHLDGGNIDLFGQNCTRVIPLLGHGLNKVFEIRAQAVRGWRNLI